MDLTPAPGFKRRSTASSSPGVVGQPVLAAPRRSPSFSSSSSGPSSPLSSSSSLCADPSAYHSHVQSPGGGSEVARVSSTSASLTAQSSCTPPARPTHTDRRCHAFMQTSSDCEDEGEGGRRDMYDPFNPTDGEKEGQGKQAEAEGEKYDPFDPTGSPASDVEEECVKVVERKVLREEEEAPDSTDTTELVAPCLPPRLPLRRRVDCKAAGESDHSELEEGEIVGALDRDGGNKRPGEEGLSLNSPSVSFFSSKPERILRVLEGDSFVSVCTEASWELEQEEEEEPLVGVEDLRRKLVSRRNKRYLSFPATSPLSPPPPLPPALPPASASSSPLTLPVEAGSKSHKFSKSSKERQKSKDSKAGEKEVRRKKRRKAKEGLQEGSKEKERKHKTGKEVKGRRSSRSSSRKRKKRRHSSPEAPRSQSSSGRATQARSFSRLSEERHRDREREREKDRGRERERDRGREHSRTSSHRREERERDSHSGKREREREGRLHSSSRERALSKTSKRSRGKREDERERRRDGRPVVPPSIQDLNGSDLFAIKRTITVTTTTTTTTVPGSPRLPAPSPCRPPTDPDKPHKRKKKRKWRSGGEAKERGSHSRSQSLSPLPPRYHGYESDHYSDKLEIDVLSLDGEALDSDYPSLEDTPPAALPPQPSAPSPKVKVSTKSAQHHPKKKCHVLKKLGPSSSSSSSNRNKGKCLSSLTVTSGSASVSPGLPSVKRARKTAKEKERDKGSRKEVGRSAKSKKESGSGRKSKLQSKVSVLVREGVSSTTGTSVGSGKMGMDLLGPGGGGPGPGGSVVGGSIAVVFCRDNESRSPFLKPCSEPLSLGTRSKDLSAMGKRSGLAAPPSALTGPSGLKAKKAKPSSITSTSSSASSPSSSLATKRRRRLAKKTREKGAVAGLTAGEGGQSKPQSEGWGGASLDGPAAADGNKPLSPHSGQAGPAPCSSSSSSSSSSTSVLPPSSSPPHTPPPSLAPLREPRDSSPDSQTVDSSCKTPEPSFLAEDCPSQTSPAPPASSPSSLSTPQGAALNNALSMPAAKPLPPDDAPKSVASPPCLSSSAGLASLSLPLSSSDPSSSSSVSSSSTTKLPPPPPPPAAPALPWSLQTGVDCTTGGVLALTALLFKMEEANIASRAKAQEFIQATSQILSQANQSQSQQHAPPSSTSSSSQIPPPPSLPPPPGLSPAQFLLHGSLPLGGCTKTPPTHLHPSLGGGCAQTPPSILPGGLAAFSGGPGDGGWDPESKDPDKYLKKLHTQERAVEEVKLAIKPYYQRKDINKDEYKDILRKAVHKICHSRTGEINPMKVSNLVKLYVQRYKYFRKHGRRMDEEEREEREPAGLHSS